jgi:N-acetylglucosaminyl-diphospho-decaprenol L-rhamnosyltransferase
MTDITTHAPAPRLTVVIVTWNVSDYLQECLQSLLAAGVPGWADVVVVDNASSDDTVACVAQRFPWVDLVTPDTNLGFSRANNLALRRCRTPYALLLNPDTVVPPGALEAMLDVMAREPGIGVVGPRQHGRDGRIQLDAAVRLPTAWNTVCELTRLSRLRPRSRVFARRTMGWWDHRDDRDVPGIAGSAMLLRTAALEQIGLLDETMFCAEDMDLCRRMWEAGWRVHYAGTTAITHYGGESVKRADDPGLHRQIAYQSFWLYLRKHDGPVVAAVMTASVAAVAAVGGGAIGLMRRVPGLPSGVREALQRYAGLLGALWRWSVTDKRRFSHPLAAPFADGQSGTR